MNPVVAQNAESLGGETVRLATTSRGKCMRWCVLIVAQKQRCPLSPEMDGRSTVEIATLSIENPNKFSLCGIK